LTEGEEPAMNRMGSAASHTCRVVLCAILALGMVPALAGPAVAADPVTYWVDANAGSDTNPGSEAAPFSTITKAW